MFVVSTWFQKYVYNRYEYKNDKGREYYFDNAKFVLIFFVVLAHAISPFKSEYKVINTLWEYLNILHMPCLIFISGYFSKKYIKDGKFNIQKPFTYLILYTISQILVTLFEVLILHDKVKYSFVFPRSSLWYLQCLVGWYILLPYIDKINKKLMLTILFIIGIFVGYDQRIGDIASLSRLFVHFPFFYIGYIFPMEKMKKCLENKKAIMGILLSLVCFFLLYKFGKYIPGEIIRCNFAFANIDSDIMKIWPFDFCVRIAFYICALTFIVLFLNFIPRGRTFFTKFGSRTLQVYILHRFIYLAYLEYDWNLYFHGKMGIIILFATVIVLTFILSLKLFSYPFEFLMKIKIQPLLKEKN